MKLDLKLDSCAPDAPVGGRRPAFDKLSGPNIDHRLSEMIGAAVREALAAWPAGAGPELLARLVAQALQLRLEKPAGYQGAQRVGPIAKDGERFLSPSRRWQIHLESARRMLRRCQLSSVLIGAAVWCLWRKLSASNEKGWLPASRRIS
jgi:hypothetical protein